MSEAQANGPGKATRRYPVVADVLGSDRVVINVGTTDGVKVGQRYLIYELSDKEIVDPVTEESLGKLEIPKGTGRIVHAQDRMAVLESDKEPGRSATHLATWFDPTLFPGSEKAPFRSPRLGDSVKRIY